MTTALYLGLDPTHFQSEKAIIHCPLIQIVPRSSEQPDIQKAFRMLLDFTHILFTSKSALKIFMDHLSHFGFNQASLKDKQFIAVGEATGAYLQSCGFTPTWIAKDESSEGIVKEILPQLLPKTFLLWPHSAQSRPIITNFLKTQPYRHQDCLLYDTFHKEPHNDFTLDQVDEIIFTSPSTVDAYLHFFGPLPKDKTLTTIGLVTQEYLQRFI